MKWWMAEVPLRILGVMGSECVLGIFWLVGKVHKPWSEKKFGGKKCTVGFAWLGLAVFLG